MQTKRIILLAKDKSSRLDYFSKIVEGKYSLLITKSVYETIDILSKNMEDYVAIVVDNPSNVEKFNYLNEYINGANNYLFALMRVLILST